VDVGRLVVLDRLRDVLDGFSHAGEGLELILSQTTPLPLASRCGGRFVRAIDDDGPCESIPYSVGGEGAPSGSLEPMAYLPVAIPSTKMVCISW
jgi:hypothetical protein